MSLHFQANYDNYDNPKANYDNYDNPKANYDNPKGGFILSFQAKHAVCVNHNRKVFWRP